jgi:hypothetical protein
MANIKEFYQDQQGIKYYPKFYTEAYCYLRAEHYGSVHLKMCPIRDGEVIFKDAYGFKSGRHDPRIWMQQNSESLPQQFYPEAIREKIAEANPRHVESSEEKAQVQVENLRLLQESRQRLLDNENSES